MSTYESFTITNIATATGPRYDFILRGPRGAKFVGTNGHACLKQAIHAATRSLTVPLRFDGMEDGSDPVHECSIRRGGPWPAELHVHVHSIGKPKVGKTYGVKPAKSAA